MRVLLLSTTVGYQLRSFGQSAARLGMELVLATDRCHLLDDPWRDGAIAVRFYDEEESLIAIADATRRCRIDGIVAVGDRPVVLAARAAEALDVRGNPVAGARASSNKKLMRRGFEAAGLRVPWVVELPPAADVASLAMRLRYPCVVKPLGLSGSRGVIRADTASELQRAVDRVRALLSRPAVRALRTGLEDELLIEGFIEGREYAVEALLTDGQLHILALFDKPDRLDGPFFEETIYLTPSSLPAGAQRAIAETTQRAVSALGLRHGPIHAECRVNDDGVVMLEVAARPIGGLCSRVLRFASGGELVPLEDLLLRHACGIDVCDDQRESQAAGVMMIPIPKRGLLRNVAGKEDARRIAGVDEIRITAKRDQLLEPLPEGDSYLGFIFARGETPSGVAEALRAAHARLEFELAEPIELTAKR